MVNDFDKKVHEVHELAKTADTLREFQDAVKKDDDLESICSYCSSVPRSDLYHKTGWHIGSDWNYDDKTRMAIYNLDDMVILGTYNVKDYDERFWNLWKESPDPDSVIHGLTDWLLQRVGLTTFDW